MNKYSKLVVTFISIWFISWLINGLVSGILILSFSKETGFFIFLFYPGMLIYIFDTIYIYYTNNCRLPAIDTKKS